MSSPVSGNIALENIRVRRDEFVHIWREAARQEIELSDRHGTDWYLSAVVQTCRWMAAVPPRTALCGGQTRSPVTERSCRARPELIDIECAALAQRQAERLDRPDWLAGVEATFRWAWRGDGLPPVPRQG